MKHLWFVEDNEGITGRLHYLRTKDGKEIDFVTVQDGQIMDLIEVKTKTVEGISIRSVAEYLSQLN